MIEFLIIIRLIISVSLIFFIPGFIFICKFFPKKEFDLIEKIGISVALSITFNSLAIFYSNWVFKIPITAFNTILIITIMIFSFFLIEKLFPEIKK